MSGALLVLFSFTSFFVFFFFTVIYFHAYLSTHSHTVILRSLARFGARHCLVPTEICFWSENVTKTDRKTDR